ncbi:MAG: pimeloyl-ACP methyl ester carboxylesterase [Ilumatobacter sp.]|jgi:pimeloyl-ACP methyl ester carboxylesterase
MTTVLNSDQLDAIGSPDGSPRRAGLIAEVGTALQPWRLLFKSPQLRNAPKGDGRISVALPGWKAPELSTAPLRGYLKSIGHDARSWGFGINQGDVEARRDEMVVSVRRLAEESGRPVNLLGWSLGGVVAREVARTVPEHVHRVVIYGSPVVGGPTHTAGVGAYTVEEVDRIRKLQAHMDATAPVTTPITTIFTRNDTVVDWRACIDRFSLDVTTVEVGSTHIGLGIDPDVWLTIARALAENDDV